MTIMFDFLKDFLRCPEGGKLELEVFKKEYHKQRKEDDIIEGTLTSKKTGKKYPIRNGIPRLLPNMVDNQTKSRFEFQWKKWGKEDKIYGMSKKEWRSMFFDKFSSKKVDESFLKGKTVIEAGCGHGLMSEIISPLCKEYIGLDIGGGIDVARWRSKDLPNVQLIQGDILNMPLKDDIADYLFSIGVIHHTRDTYRAYVNLSNVVKKGGDLMVWVYPKGSFLWEYSNKILRFFTTRMPARMLYPIAFLLTPVLYIVPAYVENRPGKNTKRELAQSIYDWLSPKYQTHHSPGEIVKWYKKNNFKDIEALKLRTGVSGVKVK